MIERMRSINPPSIDIPAIDCGGLAFPRVVALADVATAPMRQFNRVLNGVVEPFRRINPFATPHRRTGNPEAARIDWDEEERQWHETHRPAAAPELSRQAGYDRWVASRSRAPTQREDRNWARQHGVSQRQVDELRQRNPDPRLHRRGRRRK